MAAKAKKESVKGVDQMCCLGDQLAGTGDLSSLNTSTVHHELDAPETTINCVHNKDDIESPLPSVMCCTASDQQALASPTASAQKKSKFPFAELVSLLAVFTVASEGTLAIVEQTNTMRCDHWWIPFMLLLSVAIIITPFACWIVEGHLIGTTRKVAFLVILTSYIWVASGAILVSSNQILCHQ